MIPGMQWLWWMLGHVLPAWPKLPVVLMSAAGVASVGLVGGTFGLLGGRLAGTIAALVVLVNPAHAAWSSSAYNVILPFFFCAMAMFSAAWCTRQDSVSFSMKLWVGSSLALAVALRMDTGMTALLVAAWLLTQGRSGGVLQRLRSWMPAGALTVVMAGACIWPLIWPGGLPGDGERSVAIFNNITFLDVYGPFSGEPGLALMLLAGIVVARERAVLALTLVGFAAAHHVMMASFDDFGERHALVALPAIAGLSVWPRATSLAWARRGRPGLERGGNGGSERSLLRRRGQLHRTPRAGRVRGVAAIGHSRCAADGLRMGGRGRACGCGSCRQSLQRPASGRGGQPTGFRRVSAVVRGCPRLAMVISRHPRPRPAPVAHL